MFHTMFSTLATARCFFRQTRLLFFCSSPKRLRYKPLFTELYDLSVAISGAPFLSLSLSFPQQNNNVCIV